VGEYVSCRFEPADFPTSAVWTASAGGLDTPVGNAVWYTAPSNAATATVTANVAGTAKFKIMFFISEPRWYSSVFQVTTYPGEIPIGTPGAAMFNYVWIGPTDVSFYRVEVSEVGCDATGVTGYFADTNLFSTNPAAYWHHYLDGASGDWNWGEVSCRNKWGGDGIEAGDMAGLQSTVARPLLPPWTSGGFEWDIPVKWRMPGGPTNPMTRWVQKFTIDSNGTVTIQKFGKQVTRTTNDVVVPHIPRPQ